MFGGLDAALEAGRVVREGEVREEREKGILRATFVILHSNVEDNC